MSNGPIYLDCNATTPLNEDVKNHVLRLLENWGNPSSIHYHGRGPKTLMRDARRSIAELIHAEPLEVIFTSGGSESNNLALKGILKPLKAVESKNEILVSAVEHPSVMATAKALTEWGYRVQVIPVSRDGSIDLQNYSRLLTEKTAMVSCMLANNETGNIFPIREMAQLARMRGVLFHCDGVQGLGKIPVDVKQLDVDLMSFSAHKFYSLKGCGFLYVRRGVELRSLIHGGGQERGRRAGTENVLAISAMGLMSLNKNKILPNGARMAALRDTMEQAVLARIPQVTLTGASAPRLPNSSSMVIDGVDGEILLMNLDIKGFSVSTGAACSSGSSEPSPVLLAMGLTRKEAQNSLRISLGWETTEQEIEEFIDVLSEVVAHIRSFGGESRVEKCLTI